MSVVVLVFGPAEATSECLQLEDERTYLWRPDVRLWPHRRPRV